ncbi:hypothetical protein ZEAMMB73_Zm00001d012411 [Zea mays]|uniref:Protein kinase domain-containing protein n=1 Tax=Zea mays TaxID=4577 RepID=A0A1D6G8M2_MAIZE|nr:hypothetical protein ZEAMMB73_Zm00001d012411 [Zea mays]AQK99497.1 hypothetical protein ZEAMMB73_Zm00001d012411 [Zea mays]
MELIGKVCQHQNIVPLRAYYYSKDEKLLVYDYVPLGSLCAALHGNKAAGRTPLDWETRVKITLGTTRGMAYLHSHISHTTRSVGKESTHEFVNTMCKGVHQRDVPHLQGCCFVTTLVPCPGIAGCLEEDDGVLFPPPAAIEEGEVCG